MMVRHRLANRRALETFTIEHEGQRYYLGLGRELVCIDRERLGPVVEIWLNNRYVNSPVDVLASDGAILMSLLLQYGHPASEIAKSMKKNPDGSPSSPLGRAAALIAQASQDAS